MSTNTSATRRDFVAAAVLAGISPSAGHAAPARPALRIGVASYSLRKFSRSDAIKMLRQLGVESVNVKDFHLSLKSTPEELAAASREFRDAGLTITGGGTITLRSNEEADLRRYFEYAKNCGMPLMVIAPTQRNLPLIEKLVKEYDIKAAIHNHGLGDKNFPTPEVALRAVEGLDRRVGLCMDVGYTAQAGLDVVETVRQAGSRLLDMHLWDVRSASPKGEPCPVGDGVVPVGGMFKQLIKLEYAGMVNLEYELEPENPLPGMAKSLAYMRGVLAGLTA